MPFTSISISATFYKFFGKPHFVSIWEFFNPPRIFYFILPRILKLLSFCTTSKVVTWQLIFPDKQLNDNSFWLKLEFRTPKLSLTYQFWFEAIKIEFCGVLWQKYSINGLLIIIILCLIIFEIGKLGHWNFGLRELLYKGMPLLVGKFRPCILLFKIKTNFY